MRKKIVKYGKNYLEVDVYEKGEKIPECVVIEPLDREKPKETFIDKIINFFDKLVERYIKERYVS